MSCFVDEHSTSTLVDHPPNPNHPISETFPELHLKRSFFLFFHPSLRTLSSDINPPLSFHPHVQPIFPR